MDLQKGDMVRVRSLGERVLERRVAEVRGQTILICTDEEFQRATEERRQPTCIGFPIDAIIEVVTDDASRLAS